ncbi:hypothetical protein I203_102133 [Kwoniella mangroviensis CBS 8507]|uniref:uncharacterized protein n=1 Tax=Kwoniella mangroviensis CBS 8507 TaxID=1296122 RepID=UPI00080CF782|nr:uncharacterized protein I203_03328 [Kwoniella mangroviensis CBS 8507]OCF67631.1 hypothetical protein I203_03328 [Kwoniella mangroviensis CBS 8507]
MSSKVKVVACVSTTLRSTPHLRPALPFINPPRHSTGTQATSGHDPNLPGCSKWFSSTCSQLTIPQRTFFTSNHDSSPSQQATRILPAKDQNEEEFHLHKTTSTPHLPLPPRLPYSPNSYPFKRHMEILSLSLYSCTVDESWTVYTSLHPSLRRYIPDETFKSLVGHQVAHPEQQKAWSRVRTLLRLAKKCRMSLSEIDQKDLIRIIRLGLRRYRAEYDRSKEGESEEDDIYKLVKKLWITLESKIPLDQFPHELKRGWLGLHLKRLQKLGKKGRANKEEISDRIKDIEEMVIDMVKKGAINTSLGHYIGDILISSSGNTLDGLKRSFKNLTLCIAQGVNIKHAHLHKIVRKLDVVWSKEGNTANSEYFIPSVLESLNIDPISNTSRILYSALDTSTRRARTRVQKALGLLEDHQSSVGGLIGRGISVSKSTGGDILVRLDTAIRLLELALQQKEGDCGALISSLTIALHHAKRSTPHSSSSIQDIDKSIIRYVRSLHESQVIPQLSSESIIPLFKLILSVLPSSEAYILSRKIYQHARSTTPLFKWSLKNLYLWQKLFRYSLTSPNLHLHFASRLYTDLLADGLSIRKPDMLLLIRSTGMKSSPSRAILLERHIKDYLWSANHGHSLPPLVLALTQGLTHGGIQDTDLALNLTERLLQDQPVPVQVLEILVSNLSRSTRSQDRIRVIQLLQQVDGKDSNAIRLYNIVLSNSIKSSSSTSGIPDDVREENGRLSHQETLGYAIYLYKEMISKGIKPNNRIVSNMIRVLLDSGHLDSALDVFKASIDSSSTQGRTGFRIKSNVVGRLMVNLAMANRTTEANQVESSWRKINETSEGKVWDKGVIGARILIDIKDGKEVDMDQIMKQTGWKGKKGFLNFLQSLRPPSSTPPTLTPALVKDRVDSETREVIMNHDDGNDQSVRFAWDPNRRNERDSVRVDLCMSSEFGMIYH